MVKAASSSNCMRGPAVAPCKPSIPLIADQLTGRRMSPLAAIRDAHGNLQSPAQLRAQIMRPLELIKAETRLLAQRAPLWQHRRQQALPPHRLRFRGMFSVWSSAPHVPRRGDRVPATSHCACRYAHDLQDVELGFVGDGACDAGSREQIGAGAASAARVLCCALHWACQCLRALLV